ncbi:phage tail fiber protein [Enterobacter hormaechei]|uniref:phage tail fiber domain-containing protein n=1 Tax=Enterobacter hormaechei TaxID=158836 RepID=UPI003D6DF5C5
MSVPNQTPYIIYNANGLTTVFPFEFYIINAGDIQVSINGTTVTSGYSVSGTGNVGGGDVTFITPPASGSVVMLERVVPTYRLTDYQDNGDLLADTVNKDFDRLWMAIQRSFIYLGLALRRPLLGGPFNAEGYRIAALANPINAQDAATKNYVDNVSLVRALRVPESSVNILPPVDQRANKLLAFNAQGQPITVLPQSGSASDVLVELAKPTGAGLIGLDPSGTVADAVTYVTPEMFGAIGDDPDKDDYAALQAAIDTRKPLLLSKRIYHTSLPLRVYTGTVIHGAGTSKSVIRKVGTAGLTDQPAITDPWGTSRVYNGIDAIIIALPNAADINDSEGITRAVTGLSLSDFALDRHAPRDNRWDPETLLRHYANRSYVATTTSGYGIMTYALAEFTLNNLYITCFEYGFWSNNSWVGNINAVRSESRSPFTINAGTSISFNSCYAINANPNTSNKVYYAYDLFLNYSSLNACAADGTGRDGYHSQAVYYLGGQITVNGSGCEVSNAVRAIDIKGYSSVNFSNFNIHVFNNKYNTDGSIARGLIRVGEAAKVDISGIYFSKLLQGDEVNPAIGYKPVFAEVGLGASLDIKAIFSVGNMNRITGVNDGSYNQVYLGSKSSAFRYKGLGTELDYSVVNGDGAYTGPHLNQNYTRNPIVIAHDVTPGTGAIISLGSRVVTSNPQLTLRAAGTQYQDGAISVSNSTTPSANFSGSVMQYSAGVHQFTGSVRPAADNTYNLGAGGNRWAAVFAANGTIQTSDKTKKKDIQSIDERVLSAWSKVQFYQYRWKEGDSKNHFGVLAQEILSAFASEGLDALDYGLVTLDDGVYGVSYSEAMLLELALLRCKLKSW